MPTFLFYFFVDLAAPVKPDFPLKLKAITAVHWQVRGVLHGKLSDLWLHWYYF